MITYNVIIITRNLEKYNYLINAENVETAKRKAISKLCHLLYGMKIPYKEVIVYKTDNMREAAH